MISFDEERISALYYEMKSVYAAIKKISLTVEETPPQLLRCIESENVERLLWKAGQQLKMCAIDCSRLCRGLEDIRELYSSCDRYIYDDGEDAIIKYTQPESNIVDLSDEKDVLTKFSFSLF